ncbi:MAG: hypothetical protein AB8B99_18860 [Phormidesmis sp.]
MYRDNEVGSTQKVILTERGWGHEDGLERILSTHLRTLGEQGVKQQVYCNGFSRSGGVVDIMSENYLIEVKKHLSNDALRTALGQVAWYRKWFPTKIPVIAGFMNFSKPRSINASMRQSAKLRKAIVAEIHQQGIELWLLGY